MFIDKTTSSKCNNEKSMITLLFRLWGMLSNQRKFQFWLVLFLMVSAAILEIVSLGSIVPFLGVMINPAEITKYPSAMRIFELLAISSNDSMRIGVSIFFVLISLGAGLIRLLLLWGITRIAYVSGSDLSYEIYIRTLSQPYIIQVNRNSSEVISSLNYKVSYAVNALLQSLTLLSSIILMISISSALFYLNAKIAFIAFATFAVLYFSISKIISGVLKENSAIISQESNKVIKAVQEGFGGIRDVLLNGAQSYYSEVYRNSDRPLNVAIGRNAFLIGSPRYIMEAIGISLIVGLAYYASDQNVGLIAIIPTLGAFALGAQRLLPIMQQTFSAWGSILGGRKPLEEVLDYLALPAPNLISSNEVQKIKFDESIEFRDVTFRYNESTEPTLNKVSFKIAKGERVGIIGATGSGKSTLLDILMGLIDPIHGRVLVDGDLILGDQRVRWQKNLAHVPQNIFLADASIMENIAIGVPFEDIDENRVRLAAQKAGISHFIEALSLGYRHVVGERGARLSGGQRQRLAIARAFYKGAKILILDEATSALDNKTESTIMGEIESFGREMTLIIVAHRLTTLNGCDRILEVVNGKVIEVR